MSRFGSDDDKIRSLSRISKKKFKSKLKNSQNDQTYLDLSCYFMGCGFGTNLHRLQLISKIKNQFSQKKEMPKLNSLLMNKLGFPQLYKCIKHIQMPNLIQLSLNFAFIYSLQSIAMSSFSKLRYLSLKNNKLVSISFLRKIDSEGFRQLDLYGNKITNLQKMSQVHGVDFNYIALSKNQQMNLNEKLNMQQIMKLQAKKIYPEALEKMLQMKQEVYNKEKIIIFQKGQKIRKNMIMKRFIKTKSYLRDSEKVDEQIENIDDLFK